MFSCTKALTAGAMWLLLADGSLKLDTRAGDLIPEFATNGKEVVTVEQLLTHTSGFPTAPLGPRGLGVTGGAARALRAAGGSTGNPAPASSTTRPPRTG